MDCLHTLDMSLCVPQSQSGDSEKTKIPCLYQKLKSALSLWKVTLVN